MCLDDYFGHVLSIISSQRLTLRSLFAKVNRKKNHNQNSFTPLKINDHDRDQVFELQLLSPQSL